VTGSRTAKLEDRRQFFRSDVNEHGCIFGDGSSIFCTVINISADGAALEVPQGSIVADRFKLMTFYDRIERDCRTVWRMDDRLGVQFTLPI
jgi:hypothetical protein